jgi:hypothetical protein
MATPAHTVPELLLRDADHAVYIARQEGGCRYEIFDRESHLQNHREQAAISPDAGFVLSALQCGTVWSTFGYGRDEDFDFRTRRDRGGLVLIQFFGFLLTAYVMSLRI